MSTTRIYFRSAIAPDGHQKFIQFFLESTTQKLKFVSPPPLRLDDHRDKIDKFKTANCDADNVVSDLGDALWNCIATHGNAARAFQDVLEPGSANRSINLSFTNGTGLAKDLPWEAMRESDDFLCFDRRIPILREVETDVENQPLALMQGEKLRFLAVIAARGDDGRGEWAALKKAVGSIADDLPVQGLILTSSSAIAHDIAENGPSNFTAGAVPDDTSTLVQTIQDFGPHIAHFFCHGHASGNLELERRGVEFGDNKATWLKIADLEQALALSTWVTVLNACSLAAASADPELPQVAGSLNLCEELVKNGFPMVIGMRAPVNAGDAQVFARHFHTSALRKIAKRLSDGNGPLSLAESFGDACRAILGGDIPTASMQNPSWTMPVMNLRSDELVLERVENAPMAGKGGFGGLFETLSKDTPAGGGLSDLLGGLMGGSSAGGSGGDPSPPPRSDPLQDRIEREEVQGELDALNAVLRDHSDEFQNAIGQIQDRIDMLKLKLNH